MNSQPFQRFIDLITYDQTIHVVEKEIKALEKEIAELNSKIKEFEQELSASQELWHDAQKEVALKELEMKALDDLEKEAQKKIDSAQNQKEYVSLKKEIDNLKTKQHEFEDTLIQAWNTLETTDRDYKHKLALSADKIGELHNKVDEKRKKILDHEQHVREMNLAREERTNGVPAEWLEKYAMMRSRIPNPVVPVISDACGACFYKIPQQDLMALRRRKLLQCKDCYRFLYLETSQLEPETQ